MQQLTYNLIEAIRGFKHLEASISHNTSTASPQPRKPDYQISMHYSYKTLTFMF